MEFFYTSWIWVPGAMMIAFFSLIYLLEWQHPRLRLPHIHHSNLHWLKGLGFVLVDFASGYVMATYLLNVSIYFNGALGVISLPYWVKFAASFLILDGLMYCWHRLNHVYPALWKGHELHHKEKELNIFSAVHFAPREILYSTIWKMIVYPALGILPEAFFIYNALFFIIILLHHSNYKMGYWWDKVASAIIITPGLHHLHHSVNLKESNSNYGSVFSFWDRIFGSITKYVKQQIEYGVKKI